MGEFGRKVKGLCMRCKAWRDDEDVDGKILLPKRSVTSK